MVNAVDLELESGLPKSVKLNNGMYDYKNNEGEIWNEND